MSEGKQGPITPAVVGSEIAAFLAKWDEEVDVMRRGFKGFAAVAQHKTITKRIEAWMDANEPQLATLTEKARQTQIIS